MDDSGFLRTPNRPVELLGTRERYPRSVKTMLGARGPDFLGGSAIAEAQVGSMAAWQSRWVWSETRTVNWVIWWPPQRDG